MTWFAQELRSIICSLSKCWVLLIFCNERSFCVLTGINFGYDNWPVQFLWLCLLSCKYCFLNWQTNIPKKGGCCATENVTTVNLINYDISNVFSTDNKIYSNWNGSFSKLKISKLRRGDCPELSLKWRIKCQSLNK